MGSPEWDLCNDNAGKRDTAEYCDLYFWPSKLFYMIVAVRLAHLSHSVLSQWMIPLNSSGCLKWNGFWQFQKQTECTFALRPTIWTRGFICLIKGTVSDKRYTVCTSCIVKYNWWIKFLTDVIQARRWLCSLISTDKHLLLCCQHKLAMTHHGIVRSGKVANQSNN